ncbi:MAG TPA: urease accessory protein UreD [Vicinamibacterales bacterium]|nr:urease accessory protein UreD [Vicinamibacterales bacterium]
MSRARDTRAAATVGRTARLELVFEHRGGRTVLAHGYAEPPLRVARTFDLDGAAYAILVCAGPGVFGGDTLTQAIRVGRDARVVLTSQAALQLHPSAAASNAPAVLRHSYVIESGAELHCHWDPVIPFAGARVDQQFDLQVADDSRFCWSDAVLAGRISRGEVWQFSALAHELVLRVGRRLAYLERYAVAPCNRGVQRTWIAGPATRVATALVRHPAVARETVEDAHRRLAAITDIVAAVDLLEPSLALARIMATDGASFGRARTSYREWTLESIFGRPELAGRK